MIANLYPPFPASCAYRSAVAHEVIRRVGGNVGIIRSPVRATALQAELEALVRCTNF